MPAPTRGAPLSPLGIVPRAAVLLALLGAPCEARLQARPRTPLRAERLRAPPPEEQAPAAPASRVGDAVEVVVRPDTFAGMPPRAQALFTLAAQMTEANWRFEGGEGEQALKARFVTSKVIQAKVAERCPGEPEEGDCAWKQADALLCQLLQLVGDRGGFGDLQVLENAITANAASSGNHGVDWAARAAMIARWRDQARVPKLLGSTEFGEMRQRVIAGRYVDRLVNRTCLDLSQFRPECRSVAQDALFCEALAQASTVVVGSDSGHKMVLAKMEELAPQAQGLLGWSPLQRRTAAASTLPHGPADHREGGGGASEAAQDAAPRPARAGAPSRGAPGGAPLLA